MKLNRFIVDYIVEIMRSTAVFLGLIALLGLLLQRKPFEEVLKGTLKTIIGMLILLKGVDIISASIQPLAQGFTEIFAIEGDGLSGSFGDFLGEYGSEIGTIMLLAFLGNLIIARFTKLKGIYLSGHLLFWYPMLFLAVGVEAGLEGWALIAFALAFDIIAITVGPFLMIKPIERLTGKRDFTVAHTATPFLLLGDFIGGKIGNKENSTENLNFPKKLSFMSDTTITSGLVMFLVYFLVAALMPSGVRAEVMGDNWVLTSITEGLTFAAGLVVILTGVRMFLAEIVPAFKGISDKLVPGAVPGLDIPIIFPYGPKALLIGFIVALGTSIATIFLLGNLGFFVVAVIPLTIAAYFDVAPAAILANNRGGVVPAVITSVIGGILLIVVAAYTIPLISNTAGDFLQLYGGNEFSVWTAISSLFSAIFS